MTSPRLTATAIRSLSPRPVDKFLNVSRSASPRTPKNNSGKLKIEHHKISVRNRFSPFKVDTPNRAKILNDGLPDKEHAVLGSGCFGTVYRASYRGDQVAAKIVRRRQCSDAAVKAEKHAAFLRHSNIVKVLAIEQGAVWSLITMELCGTSLQDRLDETILPREERVATWRAISNALQFCHRAGIIHADVKPKNVLIATDGQPKLADFGSSVNVNEPEVSTCMHLLTPPLREPAMKNIRKLWNVERALVVASVTEKCLGIEDMEETSGTPGYIAPEVIRGKSPSSASDIYSLGVLAWQLLSRDAPFAGLHAHTILYLTGNGKRPADGHQDDGFHGMYKNLYRRLWSERIQDRPSLAVILKKLDDLKKYT